MSSRFPPEQGLQQREPNNLVQGTRSREARRGCEQKTSDGTHNERWNRTRLPENREQTEYQASQQRFIREHAVEGSGAAFVIFAISEIAADNNVPTCAIYVSRPMRGERRPKTVPRRSTTVQDEKQRQLNGRLRRAGIPAEWSHPMGEGQPLGGGTRRERDKNQDAGRGRQIKIFCNRYIKRR